MMNVQRADALRIAVVMPHELSGTSSGDRARTTTLLTELRALGHLADVIAPSWRLPLGSIQKVDAHTIVVGQGRRGLARVMWRSSLALRRVWDANAIHHDSQLRTSLSQLISSGEYDVVDFQHSYWRLPKLLPTVVTVHNVLANPDFGSKNAIVRRITRSVEWALLASSDSVVVFSDEEALRVSRAYPRLKNQSRVVHVGHPALTPDASSKTALRPTALFVGSMDYAPNLESARWLIRAWNKHSAESQLPDLIIAGRHAHGISIERGDTRVSIISDVPDLDPLYAGASIALMPITRGGGVRLKALEAMAWKVPIVGTRLAVDGLGLVDGVSYLRAENELEMITAIHKLSDGRLSERIADAAFDRWSKIGSPRQMGIEMVVAYVKAIDDFGS